MTFSWTKTVFKINREYQLKTAKRAKKKKVGKKKPQKFLKLEKKFLGYQAKKTAS